MTVSERISEYLVMTVSAMSKEPAESAELFSSKCQAGIEVITSFCGLPLLYAALPHISRKAF